MCRGALPRARREQGQKLSKPVSGASKTYRQGGDPGPAASYQPNDYLAHLNPQQKLAVEETDGPMLILAGAGSGKTRTLTCKIAHLIALGRCAPEQILAVTFTNKAADEMRTRVDGLLDVPLAAAPLVCTFHSFGVRALRRHADRIGYRRDFGICDRDDQIRVIKTVSKELDLAESQLSAPQILAGISWAKSQDLSPEEYESRSPSFTRQDVSRVYSGYQRFLQRSNSMDFDDLILQTVKLLRENPDLREEFARRYAYILIDEYQDTNRPQYELIRNLTTLHDNLTAVGDEDQSIYAFRGADINNILHFESDYPGARIIKLEQNYRSSQNILDAATAVVSHNVNRKGKVLWTARPPGPLIDLYAAPDARSEALWVAQRIRELTRSGESAFAILYRTNFQSRQFEEALRQMDIPYRLIGGVSFYNRREIKDSLAYLRLVSNPDDTVSLLRVINQPPRGIGQITLDRLQGKAGESRTTLWQALCAAVGEGAFRGRAHRSLEKFVNMVRRCQEFMNLPLHLSLEKTLEASGYVEWLRGEDSEEAHNRLLNLEELITVSREQAEAGSSLQDFLDQVALRSDTDDIDESAVVMMTLHNAKGLEFPVVFMAGCEEGLFPHSRAVAENDLEEERRLCYVGLTRAEKLVSLSYSRRRRFFGRESEEINSPSRFLEEVPEHLLRPCFPAAAQAAFRPPERRRRPLGAPRERQESFKTYNTPESVRSFLQSHSKEAKSGTGFVSGARIVHEKFGYGKILKVQESGDDLKITVSFPGVGIKRLLQSYARLRLA